MVRHYSDTKLFNVSNYEKVYLREKKLQKIQYKRRERAATVLQHRGHGRDNIATNETKKSTGKTDAYREGHRGCQKKSGHEGEREGYDIFSTSEREMWRRAQPSILRRMPK